MMDRMIRSDGNINASGSQMEGLRPLDLFFTKPRNGFGKFVDVVQRLFFGTSTGVHMGIIINRDCFDHTALEPGQWYLMESTYYGNDRSEAVDVIEGVHKNGFQIRPFEAVVRSTRAHGATTHVARLRNNPWDNPALRNFVRARMMQVYQQYKDHEYQMSPSHLLVPVMTCCIPIVRSDCDQSKLFCSQLACTVYQKLFVLKKLYPNGTEVAPQTLLDDKDLFESKSRLMG